jgi:hypothetical protein
LEKQHAKEGNTIPQSKKTSVLFFFESTRKRQRELKFQWHKMIYPVMQFQSISKKETGKKENLKT